MYHNRRTAFFISLFLFASFGILLLAYSLLPAHKAGTVISVEKIRQSNTSKHDRKFGMYHTTAIVREKGSSTIDTVSINVRNYAAIPHAGDEIEYANFWMTGYGLYPGGGVRVGIVILIITLIVLLSYLTIERRKKEG